MKLTNQDAIAAMDADFAHMAVKVGQHAWGLPQLTMREKSFVFVAADMCHGALGFPLQTHVQMALAHGVSMTALREAVRHLAPYVGYPIAAEALMALTEIQAPEHASTGVIGGAAVHLDRRVLSSLTQLDQGFSDFFADQFAERWGRGQLTIRERALATIATDVLNGTLDDSLRLHIRLAQDNGAREEQIRAVVLQVAEFGIAKAWAGFRALRTILTEAC